MNTPDVIVVGGGVIGCAAAYFLAREGVSVTLLERDTLAAHASGAAAGILAPICESEGEGALFDFGTRSLEMFPALADELRELSGIDPQYVPSGVLHVAETGAEEHALRARAARLAAYGLEWLPPDAARAQEPLLTPGPGPASAPHGSAARYPSSRSAARSSRWRRRARPSAPSCGGKAPTSCRSRPEP